MTADEIKRANPLDSFLLAKGIPLSGGGTEKTTHICPRTKHKPGHRCVSVNTVKQTFNCNDCPETGGTIIDWMKIEQGKTVAEVLQSFNGAVKSPATPKASFDWAGCVAALTDDKKRKLADWRGLSPEFVDWLHRERIAGFHAGRIAFAVHKAGQIVGCHYLENRTKKLWKYHPAGNGTQPLVFGDPGNAVYVLCFESQWDGFAVMDRLDWHLNPPANYAVLITRGAKNGKLIAGLCSPEANVYAFVQNDEPDENGTIAAGKWLADIAAFAGCKVLRISTPPEFKDANDWTRAGAGKTEIETAIRAETVVPPPPETAAAPDDYPAEEKPDAAPPVACPLSALVRPIENDASELLRRRFLCRGGGMLLCGPTGIGKSALALQAAILWAVGRACFGIEPTRPLKSLIVQAENDAGDLAEMRDGVIKGLGLTEADAKTACDNVLICREDEFCGAAFWGRVRLLLAEHKPDILWVDPALAYLGGESNAQKDVGAFLRNGLNPFLREYDCGGIVIHHTNKPPTGREKSNWQAGDFAYLGAGSAEWANWARAVLAVRSIGSHSVFELCAGKRGARLDWQDDQGAKSFVKHIAHATEPGVICWHEAAPDEIPSKGGAPKKYDPEEIFDLLPPEGLARKDWVIVAKDECGVSEATVDRARKELKKAGRIAKSPVSGKWQPVTKREKP